MCAYQPSRLCECCAASWRPAPVAMRITSGTLNCPPDMCRSVAALFTIWSSASRLKLTVMISTIGRIPPSAAPMPAPTNADSDSGVSRMRSGPNSSSRPLLTRVAAAVAADVLAHQEHALVGAQRLADRLRASPRGRSSVSVAGALMPAAPPSRRSASRSSTGSQRAGLGERDRRVDLVGDRPLRAPRGPSSVSSPAASQLRGRAPGSGRAASSCSTSALSRYSSGSYIECARKR